MKTNIRTSGDPEHLILLYNCRGCRDKWWSLVWFYSIPRTSLWRAESNFQQGMLRHQKWNIFLAQSRKGEGSGSILFKNHGGVLFLLPGSLRSGSHPASPQISAAGELFCNPQPPPETATHRESPCQVMWNEQLRSKTPFRRNSFPGFALPLFTLISCLGKGVKPWKLICNIVSLFIFSFHCSLEPHGAVRDPATILSLFPGDPCGTGDIFQQWTPFSWVSHPLCCSIFC